jgi:homoprotocatechuate degradation regulator HpaR
MGRSGGKSGALRTPGDEQVGTEPAAASRQLPVLLHRAREALAVHFRKVFVQHELTDPQWRVLRILSQFEGIDVNTLARKSYLMRESLSRILKDLAKRGLIVRRVSNTDARRFLHSLTAKGRHLLEQVAPAFNPVYKEIESRFSIQRIEELNRRLAELLEAVQLPDEGEEAAEDDAAERSAVGKKGRRSR